MLLRAAVYSTGFTIFAGTTYVVGLSYAPAPKYTVSDEKRAETFNTLAPQYEKKTRKQEFYLGIGRMRRRVIKDEAHGRVLEVGCGTGNNLGFYPNDTVKEVVFCDRTPAMVQATKAKIEARLGYTPFNYTDGIGSDLISKDFFPPSVEEKIEAGAKNRVSKLSKKVDILGRADPTDRVFDGKGVAYSVGECPAEKIPFEDNSFDTVVDMFGLCSFDDPVAAMKEMSRVCKPDGKLVLLEHGRGTWGSINGYLDKWAPRHAKMWGCWWNRDIRRYLRMSGCVPISREEKHFGTTQLMVMTPYKEGAEAQQIREAKKRKQEHEDRTNKKKDRESFPPR